jgi:hypothetical protein
MPEPQRASTPQPLAEQTEERRRRKRRGRSAA